MDLKLRCSASGCDCVNFVAATSKDSLRVCDGCSHSWMTHLLEKLLTSRDDALSIFDVCSLALYGTHALPIRLKIVIERLLATLQPDEVDKILRSFGWTPQDLARGYMIQDPRGGLLVRWSMPPRDEEILILQQFLRFQATRALSFALLRDDFPLMSPAASVSLPNNSFTSLFHPSLLNIPTTNQPAINNNNPLHSNNHNNSTNSNNTNNNLSSSSSSNNSMLSPKSPVNHNNNNSLSALAPGSLFSLNNSHLNLGVPHFLANSGINSSSSSSHNPAVSLANHNSSNNNNHTTNNNSINNITSSSNSNNNNTSPNTRNHHHQNDRHAERGGGGASSLPVISTSSLGDRSRSRSGRRSTNSSALNLSVQSESEDDEMNLSTNATTDGSSGGGRKSSVMINEVVDLSSSANTSMNNTKSHRRGNHNTNNDTGHGHPGGSMGSLSHGLMGNHHHLHHGLKSGEISDNHSGGGGNHLPRGDQLQHLRNNHLSMSNELINNLTNMHKSADLMAAAAAAAAAVSMPPNNMTSAPSMGPHSRKSGQPLKRGWNPVPMAAQLVNPATMTAQGKRRVQCSVCLKTFCDKGALKIHFSAVHLREMHKCTVAGCNMMFSSRRSRNRHSANPNPKLHSPHLRRKISPHDGRSSQPLLNLNNPMLFPGSNMRFPPFLPGLGMPPQNGGMGAPSESGKDDKSSDEDTLDMKHHGKMDRDMMMDPDGSNSEASYSSANEEFLEPKSPPSNSSSKKDGARKRKLNNPVRLSNVADDSNDEFCCYDDGTVVSNEDDDIEDNDNEIDKFKGGGSSIGSPKKDGSRGSPPSDVQSPLSLTGHNISTSQNNGNFNDEKFLNQKSGILADPSYADNDKLGTLRLEDGDKESKRSQKFIKEERHERNSREISDDNHNHNEEKTNDQKRNNKSEKSSEDEEADHLGKLEALPIFSSPHNSDSSMKSEDDENNGGRSGGSPNSNGDIPIDPDNPRRCLVCGKVFQNHFGVKTHYQNVHLKLMHKCTVDGCNAAFPSKRSRDRHSSNLNLHRKLLSTSDNSNGSSTDCSLKERGMPLTPGVSPAPTGGPTFFNPYLFQNGSGPPALGLPTQALSPPMANPQQWNPFLPFHMFPAVFGAPPPGIQKDATSIIDCRFCGKSFEEGASIRNHMEMSHPDEIFRCRCCSSVFYSRKKFESHSKACVE